MSGLVEVQEGVVTDLGRLTDVTSLESVEAFRRRVARINAVLQRDLGLREPALNIVDREVTSTVVARGVTGTLRLGSTEVDIRPKHVVSAGSDWRAATVAMLDRCARRRLGFTKTNRLQLKRRTLIDQFAFGFASELEAATRYAEIRMYRSSREELTYLRGRLLVAEQLRSSLTRPHRIVCEVDTLDPDNPTNRLLHWVGRSLVPLIRDERVRRFLSDQIGKLPPVNGPVSLPTPLRAVVPRQFSHYENAVNLAIAYARGRTMFPGISDVGGAGFIVGTERLFESFLERSLELLVQDLPGGEWTVKAQASELFAVPVGLGSKYYSKPDNVVGRAGGARLVIDAKYKLFGDSDEPRVPSKPTNGDIYQMAAACVAHRCATALLVYPEIKDGRESGIAGDIRWWKLPDVGSEPIRVGAVSVDIADLGERDGLKRFDDRLSSMLMNAVADGGF